MHPLPHLVFVINPGSTSTKTALFSDENCLFQASIRHADGDLQQTEHIIDQLPLRLRAVQASLEQALIETGLRAHAIDAFAGRGGLVHRVQGGAWQVNAAMLTDLTEARYGEHASNLGAIIAWHLAQAGNKPSYIVDPPVVDELSDLARYTGLPSLQRRSAFHALNHKAVARLAAARLGRPYESLDLIIAHLGGGISVAAHTRGRVVDVNDALEEGPFSPERAGTLPTLQLLRLMVDSGHSLDEMRRLLVGRGGLYAYTGTTDFRQIEAQSANRPDWASLIEAMAYQVAKSIAALTACLRGRPDAIVLTGGLVQSSRLVGLICHHIDWLGPVLLFPGEHELAALADGVLRILRGIDVAGHYRRED
jgi:butyrate kinase